jgi:hypothetical protein
MSFASGYAVDWVTEGLAVGGAPMSYEALAALRAQGVDCILNLCDEFCDLHWIEADQGFEVYYLPIPDEQAPDLAELEKALDWLDEAIYLGKRVLIHCRHGIGRTGTVLNAYLLRKGLGHKLAGRTLRPLRAKPQNFSQWRFVRRYGKQAGRLSVREPSLESRNLVDLYPFFADYERAVEDVDVLLGDGARPSALCGRDHDRCCRDLVTMPLIEAVYLNHAVAMTLSRADREGVILRAVEALRALRRLGYDPQDPATRTPALAEAAREAGVLCPLSEMGECLVFDSRPLACRLADLAPRDRAHQAVSVHLPGAMKSISANLFFAYTSQFPKGPPMIFTLPEVVSGKFVQSFFYSLMRLGEADPGAD